MLLSSQHYQAVSITIVLVEPMQVAIKSTALTHAFVIQDTGTAVTTVLVSYETNVLALPCLRTCDIFFFVLFQ